MMSSSVDQQAIPETMTAVRICENGGPEVLKVEQHPIPKPDPLEVLIRVKATSCS
jgi:NADPH:quinone reductase-like Zn-dependent oxidoreductase